MNAAPCSSPANLPQRPGRASRLISSHGDGVYFVYFRYRIVGVLAENTRVTATIGTIRPRASLPPWQNSRSSQDFCDLCERKRCLRLRASLAPRAHSAKGPRFQRIALELPREAAFALPSGPLNLSEGVVVFHRRPTKE